MTTMKFLRFYTLFGLWVVISMVVWILFTFYSRKLVCIATSEEGRDDSASTVDIAAILVAEVLEHHFFFERNPHQAKRN